MVEFFFDITSPWSFLGFSQLKRFSHLCSLHFVPVIVGGLFKATGGAAPADVMNRNKLQWYQTDLQDWAAWWKEPVELPAFFPVHPIVPNRLALVHPPCTDVLFRAIFQHGRNVGEAAEAVAVLNEAGFDGQALLEKAQGKEAKQQLLDNTKRAEELGMFGVPAYVVHGEHHTTVLWGQDRVDTLLDILSGWATGKDEQLQAKL